MLMQLFWTFLKIGLFTFGGGYAMIAQIKEIVVEKKSWLSEDELMEVITIAESTPGPIAINLATYVGYKKRGFLGGLIATIGVVIPSFLIIFCISLFLDAFMQNKYVEYAFKGIKCAVAVLIISAGIDMLIKLKNNVLSVVIFSLVLVGIIVMNLFSVQFSTIVLILVGGLIGIAVNALFARRQVNGQ